MGIKQAVLAILAVVLVAGIAGAAYYVSNQLNTRTGVGSGDRTFAAGGCTNNPAQCKDNEHCVAGVCKTNTPTPTGYGTGYVCTDAVCPAPNFRCNSTHTSCLAVIGATETPAPGAINHCGASCPIADCHCLGGDACTGYECRSDLRTSCANQARAWCVNMTGNGMTCCQVGYTCYSGGNGCIKSGGGTPTPTKTTTEPPTKPPTQPPTIPPTITKPPVAACSAINYYVKQTDGTWNKVTLAELSAQAKPGLQVKFAITAINTIQVDIKINDANWAPTTKNTTTGKFEYTYNISTLGTYNVTARYLVPPAASLIFEEDARCKGTFTATATCVLTPPVWSDWSDCSKSCGGGTQTRTCTTGSCGGADNCDAIDGGKAEKACNINACESNLSIDKKAYQDESDNAAGNYTLTQEIDTVSKNQAFVYNILVTNNAADKADGVVITDPLTGQNQDKLIFKDKDATCDYSSTNKTLTCNTSIEPGQTKQFSFRTSVSDTVVNGTVIKNIACLTYQNKKQCAEKDLLVSTIVSCNHTCTSDAECSGGLTCDTTSNKCRKSACLSSSSCVCATPTVARRIVTRAPVSRAPRPTTLPDSGIMDITGVAAFGGGLLLTVIGILLAL